MSSKLPPAGAQKHPQRAARGAIRALRGVLVPRPPEAPRRAIIVSVACGLPDAVILECERKSV